MLNRRNKNQCSYIYTYNNETSLKNRKFVKNSVKLFITPIRNLKPSENNKMKKEPPLQCYCSFVRAIIVLQYPTNFCLFIYSMNYFSTQKLRPICNKIREFWVLTTSIELFLCKVRSVLIPLKILKHKKNRSIIN